MINYFPDISTCKKKIKYKTFLISVNPQSQSTPIPKQNILSPNVLLVFTQITLSPKAIPK